MTKKSFSAIFAAKRRDFFSSDFFSNFRREAAIFFSHFQQFSPKLVYKTAEKHSFQQFSGGFSNFLSNFRWIFSERFLAFFFSNSGREAANFFLALLFQQFSPRSGEDFFSTFFQQFFRKFCFSAISQNL